MQEYEDKLHPVRFLGRVLKDSEMNYHPAEKELLVDIVEFARVEIVIAVNAYLPSTMINLAEYTGMNNGVKAALAHGAKELVIVGDSRLAIQQSLRVIACRKESLTALLNTHKELTVKPRSVKYLHIVREYNAAADSLATEALESKVSRVILAESRKSELVTLNCIQEVIYELNEDSAEVGPRQEERCVHVLTGNVRSPRKTFEKFVSDDNSRKLNTIGTMAVMTRRQTKAKRVQFADEHSEQAPKGQEQGKERDGVINEHSPNDISQDQPSSTKRTPSPGAEDVDPVEIQRERRRRIAKAQDEDQK
ncbi:hypothetical protein PPTG_22098 [Phytophthora nicotianae INRA-310]|uniref:RNase H type-1 domain-containing protein n=1 Tax=Phytophthora nicotianae (strain INRA-310) TaxID=761204 RepID=W2QQK5_PHYN3|nr:hypothetical protein PPTG_22098 [Phytophthora nicotianae INRA-310]ETN15236.1 hypothetical protein PPTG_22098 [Phytophthora nicotianae INRA-310]